MDGHPVKGYRKVSEPVAQSRLCNECRRPIIGFVEFGLDIWLDVTPVEPEVERVFHKVGRRTYHVQPRAGRKAWVDWRNPFSSSSPPSRGLVLAIHPHQDPGPKAPDPGWLVSDYAVTNAPPDPDELLF